MKEFEIEKKFLEYFHELEGFGLRSERFFSDIDLVSHDDTWTDIKKMEVMTAWLKASFIAGVKAAEDKFHE